MTDSSLLTISTFARSVGLTPSALRFYDDAGLLAPATVDDRNGYRYYTAAQRHRAVLVRQMRELDVPLTTMRAVLDGSPGQAEQLLRAHADRLTERADRAWNAVAGIVRALSGDDELERSRPTRLVVGGPELAAAIRQVAPFAAPGDDGAALDCLLLDVTEGELIVVATDRYRLAARSLQLADLEGPDRRLAVAVDDLAGLTAWLRRRSRVELSAVGTTLIISDREHAGPDDDQPELSIGDDRFPAYRHLLARVDGEERRGRMIIDRTRLLDLIASGRTGTVVIEPADDQVEVKWPHDPRSDRLPAVCAGAPHPVAFSPALLSSALQCSVGPDVMIEVSPGHAAIIRSADQGSFTTLVMPQRLQPRAGGPAPGPRKDSC